MTEQAYQQILQRVTVIESRLNIVPTPPATTPVRNPDGSIILPDGTKQFPYAPTGGDGHTEAGYTPPNGPEWGAGATFRRRGIPSDRAMTVTRGGDGVVFAMFIDEEGTEREFAFDPDQLDLITPAPQPE